MENERSTRYQNWLSVLRIGLAAALVIFLGEVAVRDLAASSRLLRAHLDAPTLAAIDRRLGIDAGSGPARTISLAGSSLTMSEELRLAPLLEAALGGAAGVLDEARMGDQLADVVAATLRNSRGSADLLVVELNPFLWNERVFLHTPRPDSLVWRRQESALPLFLEFPEIRARLWQQAAAEPLLGGVWRQVYSPYALGRALEEPAQEALERLLPRARHWDEATYAVHLASIRRLQGDNFRQKHYTDGVDSDLLRLFLAWAGSRREPTVLYFHPLNRDAIVTDAGEPAWRRLRAWQREVLAACGDAGILCLDYTGLFDGRRESFLSKGWGYGHLHPPAMRELSRALARDLAPAL